MPYWNGGCRCYLGATTMTDETERPGPSPRICRSNDSVMKVSKAKCLAFAVLRGCRCFVTTLVHRNVKSHKQLSRWSESRFMGRDFDSVLANHRNDNLPLRRR